MTNTLIHRKILQIMPADKWFAEHSGDNGTFYTPVICFALCECSEEHRVEDTDKWEKSDYKYKEVCPMDGGGIEPIDFCQNSSNYKGIFLKLETNHVVDDKIVNTI